MYDGMKPEKRHMMIELILRREWEMFKKVGSMDGPVACQEDWPTFRIMRYSYYHAWSDKMLKNYAQDMTEAIEKGRNLVMEKYAYMMEFTDPAYYASKLAPYLPEIDGETKGMIDEITKVLVAEEKEFALKYPKLSAKGRAAEGVSIAGGQTSTEIYTRGELRTYSKYTLTCFLDHIRDCKAKSIDFTVLVKEKMVNLYDYASLADAESKM